MLNIKLLVQSTVWAITLLAMSHSYADDSADLEFTSEKEIPSVEKKVEKSSLASPKKPLNSNETKLPKTHYGIGYEYRKSMKEQGQKVERIVDSEKAQRPERIERPERINRPERIERPERPSRN